MPTTCNVDTPTRPTINQSDPHLFGEPESSPPRSQNGLAVRPSIFAERTRFNHYRNLAGTPSWWSLNTSPAPFATQLYLQPNDAPYSGSKEIAKSVGRSTGLHRHWVQCGQYCRWGVAQPRFNSFLSMCRQRDPSALASWMRLAGRIQGTCWGHIHMQVHATKDPCMSAGRCTGLAYLLGARMPPWGGSAATRSPSQQSYHQSRRKWPLVTKQGPNGHFDVTEYPYLNIYMYF